MNLLLIKLEVQKFYPVATYAKKNKPPPPTPNIFLYLKFFVQKNPCTIINYLLSSKTVKINILNY